MVLHLSQRPLCIDSKVVERIDRVTEAGTESLYRCALNKAIPFNEYFNSNLRNWSYRIQRTEKMLESLEPFYRKIQITVLPDRPNLFRLQGHHLYIGAEILEAPGHLEKALAKVWYQERNDQPFAQQELMEEVMTDFLIHLESGDLDIGDPGTHILTALRKVKWPFIIKSVEDYCESPWKRSEHYVLCENSKVQHELYQQVVEMSLRPLLVGSMVKAYRKLNLADRYAFLMKLPQFIRQENNLPTQTAFVNPQTYLQRAGEAIRNITIFVSSPQPLKKSRVHRMFVANFTNELNSNGYSEAFMDASFDVLLVSQDRIDEKSSTFKELLKQSLTHPDQQIAIRDRENLWMLPAKYPISVQSFGQMKASKTIIEKCGGYSFSFVMDYADVTEKLLVVDRCDKTKDVAYSAYLKDGAQGFALQNKGTAFVQFHIPSLLLKKTDLQTAGNVFEFIKKRDVDNPSFKGLGWQEVRWDNKVHAYQPKAYVDAIEWFRVPGTTSL